MPLQCNHGLGHPFESDGSDKGKLRQSCHENGIFPPSVGITRALKFDLNIRSLTASKFALYCCSESERAG